MKIPEFASHVNLPTTCANDPLAIFLLYYTPEIIDIIVRNTNDFILKPQKDTAKNRSRVYDQVPTNRHEIYQYFGIRIYMTIHIENEIQDYWSNKPNAPIHSIAKIMSRDRFQALHRRVRLAGGETQGPYKRVSSLQDILTTTNNIAFQVIELSNHIQNINLKHWVPGHKVAADEIMVRYDGQSKEVVTIPSKPTPTGFKIQAIAD